MVHVGNNNFFIKPATNIILSCALQYMHERNVLHRDLKTQNIFLTKSKIIKVSYGKGTFKAAFGPNWPTLGVGVLLHVSPLDGMLVHHRLNTPQHFVTGTHSYTWVERGTVRIKYLAQKHNAVTKARDRTRTALSGVQCANH